MLGSLSQLVALASAANGVLASSYGPKSFYPDHADFKFCIAVRFVDLKKGLRGKYREVDRRQDPNEWLQALPGIRASRAWLTFASTNDSAALAHQLASFVGGGGDWQLVVSTPEATEYWMSRWDLINADARDSRIWGVTYGCVGKSSEPSPAPQAQLDAAASRLLSALNATQKFAAKHDLGSWVDWFQRAIDSLDMSKPVAFPDYIEFVCLESYPAIAQHLFAAAYHAWVFGGMGSWNDLYFEPDSENKRYDQLSGELYSAVNDAIQQATWSFGTADSA